MPILIYLLIFFAIIVLIYCIMLIINVYRNRNEYIIN